MALKHIPLISHAPFPSPFTKVPQYPHALPSSLFHTNLSHTEVPWFAHALLWFLSPGNSTHLCHPIRSPGCTVFGSKIHRHAPVKCPHKALSLSMMCVRVCLQKASLALSMLPFVCFRGSPLSSPWLACLSLHGYPCGELTASRWLPKHWACSLQVAAKASWALPPGGAQSIVHTPTRWRPKH